MVVKGRSAYGCIHHVVSVLAYRTIRSPGRAPATVPLMLLMALGSPGSAKGMVSNLTVGRAGKPLPPEWQAMEEMQMIGSKKHNDARNRLARPPRISRIRDKMVINVRFRKPT